MKIVGYSNCENVSLQHLEEQFFLPFLIPFNHNEETEEGGEERRGGVSAKLVAPIGRLLLPSFSSAVAATIFSLPKIPPLFAHPPVSPRKEQYKGRPLFK